MKKMFIMLALMAAAALSAQNVSAKLTFSTDDGKTWSEDLPVLKNGQRKFLVKIEGKGTENRPLYGGPLLTTLNAPADFASANAGISQISGKNFYIQKLKVYYAAINKNFTFVYLVDLGERKEGVIGINNKWDKKQNKWTNAPLPALAARKPGSYMMLINIYWRVKEGNNVVRINNPFEFTVTVE